MFKPTLIFLFLLFFVQENKILCCYTSIFSFGDSLTDTGNIMHSNPTKPCNLLPNGETFFGKSTGRSCDGRLIIDFIAQALQLPLLPAYLVPTNTNFSQGANFAVGGAKAIDGSNYSLGVQLEWFKQLRPSLCSSPTSCRSFFQNSLFLVGEIGGNDYSNSFEKGESVEDVIKLVPDIISAISSAITGLIEDGAVTLMVPGSLPIGCTAVLLTLLPSDNKNDYNPLTGCLDWLNEFAQYHNQLLQSELNLLREKYPRIRIIYADYYSAAMEIYQSPKQFGFSNILSACCGAGGRYNFNLTARCGDQGTSACDDPSSYLGWDGSHLTEAAYKLIATGVLNGQYATPHMEMSCSSDS